MGEKAEPVNFKRLRKGRLTLVLPPEIDHQIRTLGAKNRQSMSYVVTEIVARGLGLDPTEFGIAPSEPSQN